MTPQPTEGRSPLFSIHPLPWSVFQEPSFRGGAVKITDRNGLIIFGEGNWGQESKFYNFLVEAVNTHAAAVECVEQLKDLVKNVEVFPPHKDFIKTVKALAKYQETLK